MSVEYKKSNTANVKARQEKQEAQVVPNVAPWFIEIVEPNSDGEFPYGVIGQHLQYIHERMADIRDICMKITAATAVLSGEILGDDVLYPHVSYGPIAIGRGLPDVLEAHAGDLDVVIRTLRSVYKVLDITMLNASAGAEECPF